MHARLFSLCAAAALVAAPLSAAHAQAESNMNGSPSRFALELYLAQYRIKTDASNGSNGAGGVGARLMFGHSDATKVVSTFFQRARAGVYGTYMGEQGNDDVSSWQLGGQLDFPLLATPMRYMDPFVSLAAGVLHTSRNNTQQSGTSVTSSDFALTPAVGALFPITGSIAFRGDLRDAIVFGNSTTNNYGIEGGISVRF